MERGVSMHGEEHGRPREAFGEQAVSLVGTGHSPC